MSDLDRAALAGPQGAGQGFSSPEESDHLEKIRSILEQHPAVADAQVEPRGRHDGQREVVAFLRPDLAYIHAKDARASLTKEARHQSVTHWSSIFDALYNREPPSHDPTLNFVGWVDTATGENFSAEEMQQWLSDAVRGILSLEPRRLLEIGCGTGMILYRVAPHCEHYHATDTSRQAVDQLANRRDLEASQGGLPPNVTLEQVSADELRPRSGNFDVIVINSAIQYFPSLEYLYTLLQDLAESLPDGGAIYLGDVRSLPLLESFYTDVLLAGADDGESLEHLVERVTTQRLSESELAIDPAFFVALRAHIPRVARVDILPKRGRGTSEAFHYRYQVILRIGEPSLVPPEPSHASWLSWRDVGSSMETLRRRLTETPEVLALADIPNARNDRSQAIFNLIKGGDVETVSDLRRQLEKALSQDIGVEPEDLWSLARELGYVVEWSWARHDARGHFDVHLTRGDLVAKTHAVRWPELAGPPFATGNWSTLATRPIGHLLSTLPAEARAHLEDRLSGGLVPDRYELQLG